MTPFTPMRSWPVVAREPLPLRPGVPLGLDFEWNVQTGEPTILGVSDGEATFSIPWSSSADALLRQLLVPEPVLVGHNFIPADRPFLPRPPYPLSKIKDTILLHWLANMHLCKAAVKEHDTAEGHGYMNLWSMMSLYSSFPYWKTCIQCDPLGPEVPCPKHSPYWYNGLDALGPLLVLPGLEADCRRKNVLGLYDLHARTAEVLGAINRIGVAVDVEYVRKVRKRWQEHTDALGAELPFNPNSPKQVIAYFKERGVALSDCQRPTIIAAAEEHPRNRVLQRLSEYKMLGDGIDRWFAPQALDETTGYYTGYVTPQGRVHPWLGFYTSSSRLMCSGPNLQNVPKRGVDPITGEKFGDVVRRAIVADDGCYLLKADFQNAEGNVILALAGETRPPGDFHEATAKRVGLKASDPLAKAFGSVREAAKSITHASNYLEGLQLVGASSLNKPTLMREVACGARLVFDNWKVGGRVVTFTGINLAKRAFGDASYVSRRRALDFLVSYYKAYPGVQKAQRRVLNEAIEGHGVRHPDGFWTALMGDLGDQAKTAMAITGSSPVATLTKRAMLNAHEDGRMRVSLQVHDELLFNVPRSMSRVKALEHVRSYMEIESHGVPGLVLPIDAKAGPNWAQVKEIK